MTLRYLKTGALCAALAFSSFALAANAETAAKTKPVKPAAPISQAESFISKIKFHGFLSAGMARSNSRAKYSIPDHGQINNTNNFSALSLAGLQAEADITPKLSAILQLVTNGNDTNGHKAYQINAEWAFLRYQVNNALQVKAGRFRVPLFMYSQTLEVGRTYAWSTLPNEVYRLVPFYDMNGGELLYTAKLGHSDWTAQLQPFFGENRSKYDYYNLLGKDKRSTFKFDEDNILGTSIAISNPYITLRAAYAQTTLTDSLDNSQLSESDANLLPTFKNQRVGFYTVGAKADYDNIVVSSEYAHRSSAHNNIAELTSYYAMVGYHINKFLPNITYAKLKTDNAGALRKASKSALIEDQRSITAGLDYYVNSHLVTKMSFSRIKPENGTNGLFDSATKGSVSLYTLSVDATF